jgi:uncharacterized integral membrane protein
MALHLVGRAPDGVGAAGRGSPADHRVVGKELRLGLRDPILLTCMLISLVVGSYALASTAALTVISGRDHWPAALVLLLAAMGGGAGLVPLLSVIAVEPLDEGGNPRRRGPSRSTSPSWP